MRAITQRNYCNDVYAIAESNNINRTCSSAKISRTRVFWLFFRASRNALMEEGTRKREVSLDDTIINSPTLLLLIYPLYSTSFFISRRRASSSLISSYRCRGAARILIRSFTSYSPLHCCGGVCDRPRLSLIIRYTREIGSRGNYNNCAPWL